MATQEQVPTTSKKYYCHTCKAEIIPVPGKEELTCPTCSSEFVEEVDPDDPPAPTPPTPTSFPPPPQNTSTMPPMLQQFMIPFGPPAELLPLAQTFHQLIRMHNTTNNNNNRTFTVQAGPIPLNNNFMFNFLQGVLPNGPPLAGNPGDYVFGGNFENILNQLFQNANQYGFFVWLISLHFDKIYTNGG
eukprot:Phypoly_transcript_15415.p1 GENE.Phypoly_transcript_15415~~Phypoly_transcript_15415.p1  ORF type:complete len:188 (+),score=41.38 Phypoly_transcript_15415:56-619(+)